MVFDFELRHALVLVVLGNVSSQRQGVEQPWSKELEDEERLVLDHSLLAKYEKSQHVDTKTEVRA